MKTNIFAAYKPIGVTSHDIVNQVRRKTGVKRVGHGGTLDPLAEGVLVIAVGRENTKKLDQYVKGDKEYLATFQLGFESETDDAEGEKTNISEVKPTMAVIRKALKKFVGTISQMPPRYSAIKINGKEAYKRIRKGETFEMKSRIVEIKEIKLVKYRYPVLEIRVVCGSGTYIRSLARDIGKGLKTGAYLSKLVRTRVGEFNLSNVIAIENLED